MSHNISYLLLGSNMGRRKEYLSKAIALINKIGAMGKAQGTKVTAESSTYNTKAWGKEDQNDFLNQAVCVQTPLEAEELLKEILDVEKELGRERSQKSEVKSQKYQPRTIDIDILLFNQQMINSPTLTVPHPHLHLRRFALAPLSEIAPELVHPAFSKSVGTLLKECPDNLEVTLVS